MKRKEPSTSAPEKKNFLQKIEALHPHLLLLYLSLIGVSLIFLFLIAGYLYMIANSTVVLSGFPLAFYGSTLAILSGSYMVSKLPGAFDQEDLPAIALYLATTTAIGVLFCVLQLIGWQELSDAKIEFTGTSVETYLYMISGIHMVHLLGGMAFLIIVLVQVQLKQKDTVSSFIYTTNPYERLKLKMLGIYWHFMDALWVLLFFAFLLAF